MNNKTEKTMSTQPDTMTKELHLKLVEAWWDGELEFDCDGKWIKPHYTPDEAGNPTHYRIRPKPTLRPWKPEEVPVGAEIRSRANPELRCLIVASGIEVVTFVDNEIRKATCKQLFDSCEHSTDGGKKWKPCGVEEGR